MEQIKAEINAVAADIKDLKESVKALVVVLERLATLEEKWRSFAEMLADSRQRTEKADDRIRALETESAQDNASISWVVGIVSSLGGAISLAGTEWLFSVLSKH